MSPEDSFGDDTRGYMMGTIRDQAMVRFRSTHLMELEDGPLEDIVEEELFYDEQDQDVDRYGTQQPSKHIYPP